MRYRTLEIRWHDSKPISSCDFQPLPFKKARPPSFATQSYRLATAGEDNHDGALAGFLDMADLLLNETSPPQVFTTSYGPNEDDIPEDLA